MYEKFGFFPFVCLRWKDQVEDDVGMPLKDAEHQAQVRPEWRRMTQRRAKGHSVLRK